MRCRFAVAIVLLGSAFAVRAAQLVSEGVTQDPVSHFYTYHYAVDNTSGSDAVVEVSVLVTPQHGSLNLPPMIHTEPSGWQYRPDAFGGPDPPSGTFEQWYNQSGVTPGTYLSGFSFSTPYPPIATPTPNYFLFKLPSGSIDIGIVEAPQLPPSAQLATVPLLEPRTLILLAIALAAVAALTLRA